MYLNMYRTHIPDPVLMWHYTWLYAECTYSIHRTGKQGTSYLGCQHSSALAPLRAAKCGLEKREHCRVEPQEVLSCCYMFQRGSRTGWVIIVFVSLNPIYSKHLCPEHRGSTPFRHALTLPSLLLVSLLGNWGVESPLPYSSVSTLYAFWMGGFVVVAFPFSLPIFSQMISGFAGCGGCIALPNSY